MKPHFLRQIPHGRTSVWLLCLALLLAGFAPVSNALLALSSASQQAPAFWEICSATQATATADDRAHAGPVSPASEHSADHGKHCQLCLVPITLGLPAGASTWPGAWLAGATEGPGVFASAPVRGGPDWAPGSPRAPPTLA